MQLIWICPVSPEEYVQDNHHFRVPPPAVCPGCGKQKTHWELGYYSRDPDSLLSPKTMRIFIRRFRRHLGGQNVSFHPSFAHPYRLNRNEILHQFATGTAC